jgi:hypothetical protein
MKTMEQAAAETELRILISRARRDADVASPPALWDLIYDAEEAMRDTRLSGATRALALRNHADALSDRLDG